MPDLPRTHSAVEPVAGPAFGGGRWSDRSFDAFYRAWFAFVLREAVRLSGRDEHFALDIVQDVMLRVIRKMPALDSPASIGAWLRATTRSCVIDRIRRDVSAAARERAAGRDAPLEPDARIDALLDALARLSPDDRDLLRLRANNPMTVAQIAAAFEQPPGSIGGRLRRAIARLRAILTKDTTNA